MNHYIGTRLVRAAAMTKADYDTYYRGCSAPADENGEDDGYIFQDLDSANRVKVCDSYFSWYPKDVFERVYRPTTGMTFGQAIEALKAGKKVARIGWNGSGQFVYLVPAASYPAQTGIAKAYFGADAMVPYRAYLALKTAQGDVATWAPSCSDALAEDWIIVE